MRSRPRVVILCMPWPSEKVCLDLPGERDRSLGGRHARGELNRGLDGAKGTAERLQRERAVADQPLVITRGLLALGIGKRCEERGDRSRAAGLGQRVRARRRDE